MPETDDLQEAKVAFIGAAIGRGHPFYLDGLIEAFAREYPQIPYLKSDVTELSHGICRLAWSGIEQLYQFGARGGFISSQYNRLRQRLGSHNKSGVAAAILGQHVREYLKDYAGPVVVSHPLLATILAHQNKIIYQHGELAAPPEAIVEGCYRIFVPTSRTAQAFIERGIPMQRLFVTGQCLENGLSESAEINYRRRLDRFREEGPLTAGLFSSGAYPRDQVRKLVYAANSLAEAGHRVIVFAGLSAKRAGEFARVFHTEIVSALHSCDSGSFGRITLLRAKDRAEFDCQTAEIVPDLDFFVAPAHERTNWAVGLGLPQFILCPYLGTYAPLNGAIATAQGVAIEINDDSMARNLAALIGEYRSEGRLQVMADKGIGQFDLNGFSHGAHELATLMASSEISAS